MQAKVWFVRPAKLRIKGQTPAVHQFYHGTPFEIICDGQTVWEFDGFGDKAYHRQSSLTKTLEADNG
ncbi:MAG TPA: hypothetical protein VKI17_03095, partial [Gemmataceae bacterium]|nr:hypothetical protein [Gemmataceae bacterium]